MDESFDKLRNRVKLQKQGNREKEELKATIDLFVDLGLCSKGKKSDGDESDGDESDGDESDGVESDGVEKDVDEGYDFM